MAEGEKPAYPLRERRKSKTRAAIVQATQFLIEEVGYDGFTLNQVAARAEVHVQTLYRHFPAKTDLIRAITRVALDEFEEMVVNRRAGTSTIDTWRAFIDKYADVPVDERAAQHTTLTMSHYQLGTSRYISVLTNGLAKDMGVDPEEDRRPYFLACLLKTVNDQEYFRWEREGRPDNWKARALRVIDEIVELFNA
jgi:AcrR family transcriptional regulator